MPMCSACGASVADTSHFCSKCGTPVADSSAIPTRSAPDKHTPTPESSKRPTGRPSSAARISSATTSGGRFEPGDLLLERYRIVGLLGKGGMGEVYRADDLTLGQPVALKFLPESLADNADRLNRFYSEVRVARGITHPSVCRVHDIGDVDGQPFLSMEYIDGEDLASLLRRIGRLPGDKALQIVRQICAGLAAAHDKGVLHRDLKPANIMIDGRGRARITDFGLAGLAEDIAGAEIRSGTPGYMAPEQIAGKEVTVKSDVFALGLVLYELFTGKRAFEGKSLAELARMHREETPTRPSDIVSDLDPTVEAVILRCLDEDPRKRPPSALAVAAALPGGDPLAEALAAGETPSPEMVAAAGEEGGLRPSIAWGVLGATLLGITAAFWMGQGAKILHWVPFEKNPEVLEDRSREILEELGHASDAVDNAWGFATDTEYLRHISSTDDSTDRWKRLRNRPPMTSFWYRSSPRPLVHSNWNGRVSWNDPPIQIAGMSGVRLDMSGRLMELYVVPPQVEEAKTASPSPDWAALFERAELDPETLTPLEPRWTPPFYCEERSAWEGSYPDALDIAFRVEAAAYRGRPVFFRVTEDWTRPEREQAAQLSPRLQTANIIGGVLLISIFVSAALLARRNLKLGRGDRRGALRLATYALCSIVLAWILRAHHMADFGGELYHLINGVGMALFLSALMWLLYVALEPFVRRRWPNALISWTRLLSGGFRDPLVGRHILFGAGAGSFCAAVLLLDYRFASWLGMPTTAPDDFGQDMLLGPQHALATLVGQQVESVGIALGLLLLLVLLRGLLRYEALAALGLTLIMGSQQALPSDLPFALAFVLCTVAWAFPAFVALRFGLLALCSTLFFLALLVNYPLTPDLSHWTGGPTILILVVAVGIAVFSFRTSLAGRPMFREDLLSD